MSTLATENYTEIKIKLLRRRTSLAAWAARTGTPLGSVYNAIKGKRNGRNAKAIRTKLNRFLNESRSSGTN